MESRDGVRQRRSKYESERDAGARAAFQKLFIAALLLTGSAAKAELSILEGIETFDGKASSNARLRATLNAAIAPRETIHREISGAQDLSTLGLPVELRRVLLLPENLRHCFVLRLLVGLPLRECSRLLSLEPCQAEQNTISAAVMLAGIRMLEAANGLQAIGSCELHWNGSKRIPHGELQTSKSLLRETTPTTLKRLSRERALCTERPLSGQEELIDLSEPTSARELNLSVNYQRSPIKANLSRSYRQ